jgi:hypothetical protein
MKGNGYRRMEEYIFSLYYIDILVKYTIFIAKSIFAPPIRRQSA